MISRRTMMNDEIVSENGKVLQLEKCKGSYFSGFNLYGKSEQNKTNGLNLFNYTNIKNGFVSNAGTGEEFSFITNSGFPNAQYVEISVKANTNYSFNFVGIFNTLENSGDVARIRFSNEENICVKATQLTGNSSKGSIPENEATKIFILALYGFNKNVEKGMLNEGITVKPYEPYTGGIPSPNINYPQEIVNAGENGSVTVNVNSSNLFSCKHHLTDRLEINGIIVTVKDNEIIFNGTAVNTADFYINKDLFDSLTEGEYTFSFNKKSGINAFFYASGALKNDVNGILTFEKTSETKYSYFIFRCENGSVFDNFIVKPMLNAGKYALPYEPYRSQKLVISTPNGLPGIQVKSGGNYTDENGKQWVCDEIDLRRGKYVQRVAHETIDKSTLKVVELGENTHRFSVCRTKNLYKNVDAMSNFAKYFIWANSHNSFFVNGDQLYYGHTEATTVEEIEKLFNALPQIEILGQLAEPIEHDLTAEEIAAYKALHTYTGTTILSNNVEIDMKVMYRKFRNGGK